MTREEILEQIQQAVQTDAHVLDGINTFASTISAQYYARGVIRERNRFLRILGLPELDADAIIERGGK